MDPMDTKHDCLRFWRNLDFIHTTHVWHVVFLQWSQLLPGGRCASYRGDPPITISDVSPWMLAGFLYIFFLRKPRFDEYFEPRNLVFGEFMVKQHRQNFVSWKFMRFLPLGGVVSLRCLVSPISWGTSSFWLTFFFFTWLETTNWFHFPFVNYKG